MSRAILVGHTLSVREREILTCLAAGERPDDLARRLYITRSTVHATMSHARQKLGATTNEHAISLAHRKGYLS
jgi:DNA-binding CsgD family transcriptional regulator